MTTQQTTSFYRSKTFLLMVGLLLLTVTGGTWFHNTVMRNMREQVEKRLTNIAKGKVAQIVSWRNERLDDATPPRFPPAPH